MKQGVDTDLGSGVRCGRPRVPSPSNTIAPSQGAERDTVVGCDHAISHNFQCIGILQTRAFLNGGAGGSPLGGPSSLGTPAFLIKACFHMHTPLITCQWHMFLKNLQHKINRTQQKP